MKRIVLQACLMILQCAAPGMDLDQKPEPPPALPVINQTEPGTSLFEEAVSLIKKHEGWHGPEHRPYVGYGHKIRKGERFDKEISEYTADSLLRSDLLQKCAVFRRFGKDSLLLGVLAYNIGEYTLLGNKNKPKSRLISKLENGDRDIYHEYITFRMWNGKVIPSIEKRRKNEFNLLFDPSNIDTAMENNKKIIRVFPSKTNATPDDENVRIKALPQRTDEADEVHISVTFSWDIAWSETAAKHWESVATVKLGGPAYNEPGGEFVPGMYMKTGYVITSRGCRNRCWFCSVPKREGGQLRELPVRDGWKLTDDNILACSDEHINRVFAMLKRQPYKPEFLGGLEAKLMTPEMAGKLRELKPERMYFAYDTKDDLEPLQQAGKYLMNAGFTKASHVMRAYVLCGYKADTFEKAEKRMRETWDAGFFPMAMLYRDFEGKRSKDWQEFQGLWANPRITACQLKMKN